VAPLKAASAENTALPTLAPENSIRSLAVVHSLWVTGDVGNVTVAAPTVRAVMAAAPLFSSSADCGQPVSDRTIIAIPMAIHDFRFFDVLIKISP
jgi:hypothetical protein